MNLTLLDIKKAIDPLDLSERQQSFLREALQPERLPALKEKKHFTDYLAGLRKQAENGSADAFQPLRFSLHDRMRRLGDQDGAFAKVYFGRHYTLTAQVLMTLVDETDQYLSSIEDLIWLLCNEYTWATSNHLKGDDTPFPFVDLFAAETAQMLAETLTLLSGRLHPHVTERARQQIEERVFSPIFNHARSFRWEAVPNNWAAVCSGSVGMAALLLESNPNRLAGMLRRVSDSMACYLQGFSEDGGCEEGIAYWNYGFGFYVYFAESLRVFTQDGIDLLTDQNIVGKQICRIAEFPAKIALSNYAFLNYSDAIVDMPLAPGLLSRVSQRLDVEIPRPKAMPDYPGRTSTPTKWAHASRALCWTDDSLFGEQKLAAGTFYFPDMGWILDRRYAGEGESSMIAFSAKGGHNQESHNHNDLGHFIIHAGGENLLVDLGQGRYGKGYAESLNKTSEGHSVPRINGTGQGTGRQFQAKILEFNEANPDEQTSLSFALDLTNAYPVAALKRFVRRFAWQPPASDGSPARILLTDTFQFDAASDQGEVAGNRVEELLVSFHEPDVRENQIVWSAGKARLELEFDPSRLTPKVERFEVGRGNHGSRQPCYRLQLSVNDLRKEDQVTLRFALFASA